MCWAGGGPILADALTLPFPPLPFFDDAPVPVRMAWQGFSKSPGNWSIGVGNVNLLTLSQYESEKKSEF